MTPEPDDDFFDLPTTVPPSSPAPRPEKTGLTERQMDLAVAGGAQAIVGAVDVLKTVFEIWKIREAASGQVEVINAQTEQLRAQLAGEIEKMRENRKHTRANGDVVIDLIRTLAVDLNQGDPAVRARFLEALPGIIEATLRGRG